MRHERPNVQPAFTRSGIAALQHRAHSWRERGVATTLLEGDALVQRLGAKRYSIGWLDPRGGSIQPLSYARGLARAAKSRGVSIFDRTRVMTIEGSLGRFVVKAPCGVATAKHVVATGAYSHRPAPHLGRSFIAGQRRKLQQNTVFSVASGDLAYGACGL